MQFLFSSLLLFFLIIHTHTHTPSLLTINHQLSKISFSTIRVHIISGTHYIGYSTDRKKQNDPSAPIFVSSCLHVFRTVTPRPHPHTAYSISIMHGMITESYYVPNPKPFPATQKRLWTLFHPLYDGRYWLNRLISIPIHRYLPNT